MECEPGVSAGGDGQLSRAAWLVARERSGNLQSGRADAAFGPEGIGGGNAVFNPEKLDWFNQQHIARLAPDELACG
jgi:hypothetical protein